MDTKPYSLQSPEQIAKDYGGNKQKIAEAMQMGVLDPTAGTMAGMFIDRMRSAAQTEAAPQQTVAQQVFAPPMPQMPAGLGATPQAAAMPAAAPMGMPSPQAVPGMAMGGSINNDMFSAPYMNDGGLASLNVPDGMFDEPTNGGYANGGLVAFARGDVVEEDFITTDEPGSIDETGAIVVEPRKAPKVKTQYLPGMMYKAPEVMGGFRNTLFDNLRTFGEEAPRETKRAEQYQAALDKMLDPAEQKKRKQEDMWMALGQIGARMAQTPGSLLQAASAGISEALPGVAAGAKERRGEQRAAQQALVAEERTANKEVETRAGVALDMLKSYNSLEQAFQSDNFKNTLTRLGFDMDLVKARIMAGAGIQQALIGASAQRDVGALGYNERRGSIAQDIAADFDKNAALDPTYSDLMAKDPAKAAVYRVNHITSTLDRIMPAIGGGTVDLGRYKP